MAGNVFADFFCTCCHFWRLFGPKLFDRRLFGRIPLGYYRSVRSEYDKNAREDRLGYTFLAQYC